MSLTIARLSQRPHQSRVDAPRHPTSSSSSSTRPDSAERRVNGAARRGSQPPAYGGDAPQRSLESPPGAFEAHRGSVDQLGGHATAAAAVAATTRGFYRQDSLPCYDRRYAAADEASQIRSVAVTPRPRTRPFPRTNPAYVGVPRRDGQPTYRRVSVERRTPTLAARPAARRPDRSDSETSSYGRVASPPAALTHVAAGDSQSSLGSLGAARESSSSVASSSRNSSPRRHRAAPSVAASPRPRAHRRWRRNSEPDYANLPPDGDGDGDGTTDVRTADKPAEIHRRRNGKVAPPVPVPPPTTAVATRNGDALARSGDSLSPAEMSQKHDTPSSVRSGATQHSSHTSEGERPRDPRPLSAQRSTPAWWRSIIRNGPTAVLVSAEQCFNLPVVLQNDKLIALFLLFFLPSYCMF